MLCSICKKNKKPSGFYIWDKYRCRECRKEIDRKRYSKRSKYLRNYFLDWIKEPKNKERYYEKSKKCAYKWKKKNWKKIKIHKEVRYALRTGKITKLLFCSSCLKTNVKIEAHHENYSKPFDIMWLCRSCHLYIHQFNQFVANLK